VYELPVIRMDDAHYQVKREDGSEAEMYKLPAGPGFILDTTGYVFHVPPDLEGEPPNLIRLVRGAGHTYERLWQEGKMTYVMTRDTLRPVRGSGRLRMFESGEILMVAVGRHIAFEGSYAEGKFRAYWMSMIYIY
jgi:hypothetical protein